MTSILYRNPISYTALGRKGYADPFLGRGNFEGFYVYWGHYYKYLRRTQNFWRTVSNQKDEDL